jgi:hypothetical protein
VPAIPSLPTTEHPVVWNKVPAAVFDAIKLINERAGRMFPGELEWVRFSLIVSYGFSRSMRMSEARVGYAKLGHPVENMILAAGTTC